MNNGTDILDTFERPEAEAQRALMNDLSKNTQIKSVGTRMKIQAFNYIHIYVHVHIHTHTHIISLFPSLLAIQ